MSYLEYYGGSGWGHKEVDFYKVKYEDENGVDKSKLFTSLREAKKFYESLHCSKACWQPQKGELLECHTLIK